MSVSAAERKYYLVVYGATGYTGALACNFLAKEYGLPSAAFNYGVAGRTESGLKTVAKGMLEAVGDSSGDLSKIPQIVATPTDFSSMEAMVKQTRAVVSFAGPYALCGEPLVKACAQSGTHYVDVTGEMDWVLKMRDLYHDVAKGSKAKIVPSCGMMALPNEIAMMYTHQMCEQRGLKMKSVTQVQDTVGNSLSAGTVRSLFGMMKNLSLSECYARQNAPFRLCSIKPSEEVEKANKQCCCNIRYNEDAGAWATPSPIGDALALTLRWSNEVQGHVWGKDVALKIMVARKKLWQAVLSVFLSFFIPLLSWIGAKLPFQAFLPAPGKLVVDSGNKGGNSKIFVTADTIDSESSASKILTCKVEYPHAAYNLSGILACESALSIIEGPAREKYGVSSASDLIGLNVLQRLEKHNCAARFLAATPGK